MKFVLPWVVPGGRCGRSRIAGPLSHLALASILLVVFFLTVRPGMMDPRITSFLGPHSMRVPDKDIYSIIKTSSLKDE